MKAGAKHRRLERTEATEAECISSEQRHYQASNEAASDTSEGETDIETSTSSESSDLLPATKDVPLGLILEQNQLGLVSAARRRGGEGATGESKANVLRKVASRSIGVLKKRQNKNRPTELSSRAPVPILRAASDVPKRRSWDPRFDEAAGKLDSAAFKKRYAFVYDESLPQEKTDTVKALKKTKSSAKKKELQGALTRLQQQISAERDDRRRKETEQAAKAQEREAVKQGKKPFFLKRSEKKRLELVRRFQDLKASGRLEKVVAKKRKKNAAKDHRYVPSGRRS